MITRIIPGSAMMAKAVMVVKVMTIARIILTNLVIVISIAVGARASPGASCPIEHGHLYRLQNTIIINLISLAV